MRLRFNNRTASERIELTVGDGDQFPIAVWYGSHYAGDDYTIRIDGKVVKKDQNGEITEMAKPPTKDQSR